MFICPICKGALMKRERTYFLIKTICCSGVRVQQLSQVTVEAVEAGSTVIRGQCGSQVLHIPPVLREELLAYAGRRGIRSGPVFITRNGSPVNRSNVSDSIRRLCMAWRSLPASSVLERHIIWRSGEYPGIRSG